MQGRAPWKRYVRADAPEVATRSRAPTRESKLLAMNAPFIKRVERAISDGLERRSGQPNAIKNGLSFAFVIGCWATAVRSLMLSTIWD